MFALGKYFLINNWLDNVVNVHLMFIYHINTCQLFTQVGPFSSDVITYTHIYKTEAGKNIEKIEFVCKIAHGQPFVNAKFK